VGGRQDYINGGQVGFSGMIAQPYSGFEGGVVTITNPWAGTQTNPQQFPGFADPAVGPLFGGLYQYLQLDPLEAIPLIRGQVMFWKDELNYIVTGHGMTGTVPHKMAGVAVNETFPGNWDFFQIDGIARVHTTAAGPIGQFINVTPAVTSPAVTTTGATSTDNSIGKVVLNPAVAGQLSTVELSKRNF
jgi:hypothetical protein